MTPDAPRRTHDPREAFNAVRRLVRDYERLPETRVGLHLVAFVFLMLQRLFVAQSA